MLRCIAETGLVGDCGRLGMVTESGFSEHISRETAAWLTEHWWELVEWLPEPGEEWRYGDVRGECPYSGPGFQVLASKGVVERVRRDRFGAVYVTCESAYTRVQEYASREIYSEGCQ